MTRPICRGSSGITEQSAGGTKPVHGDSHQPADRGLGWQGAGGGKGVEAVAGKLASGDITPQGAGLGAFGQQVADEGAQLLLSRAMCSPRCTSAASSVPRGRS